MQWLLAPCLPSAARWPTAATHLAAGLERAMDELCRQASEAVEAGYTFLVLSDRGVDAGHVPIPSLLATAGVVLDSIARARLEAKRLAYLAIAAD